MDSAVLYVLGFFILVIWFRNLLMKPIFVLITLILCLGAQTIEPIYDLDIENKTTLTYLSNENPIKQKIHIIDQHKNIAEFDTFRFRKLIEQKKASYLSRKIFPLNNRDKCYMNLDIGNVSLPVLSNTDTCAHMRSVFLDYLIKWGLILFVFWPICNIILRLFYVFVLMCMGFLSNNKNSNSE